MIVSFNTFFIPENEEEFREYVEDFREKINSSKKIIKKVLLIKFNYQL